MSIAKKESKPVVVLEIGALKRNESWRVGLNHINRDATWALDNLDPTRKDLFNLAMMPWKEDGDFVVIATQRPDSLQWEGMPSVEDWLSTQINIIKEQTDKSIVIRPHPRDRITSFESVYRNHPYVFFDLPKPWGEKDDTNINDTLESMHTLL